MPNMIEKRLIDRINEQHRECRKTAWSAVKHGIEAGELLNIAKQGLKHGEWEEWVGENFEGSVRTARVYMQLSKNKDELQRINRQTSAGLSIDAALKAISTPRDDPKALPAPEGEMSFNEQEKRAKKIANDAFKREEQKVDKARMEAYERDVPENVREFVGKAASKVSGKGSTAQRYEGQAPPTASHIEDGASKSELRAAKGATVGDTLTKEEIEEAIEAGKLSNEEKMSLNMAGIYEYVARLKPESVASYVSQKSVEERIKMADRTIRWFEDFKKALNEGQTIRLVEEGEDDA